MIRLFPLMASSCPAAAKSSMPRTLSELLPTCAVVLPTRSVPWMPASQMYGLISSCHDSAKAGVADEPSEPSLSARWLNELTVGCDFAGVAVLTESDVPLLTLTSVAPFWVLPVDSCAKAVEPSNSRITNTIMEVAQGFSVVRIKFRNLFLPLSYDYGSAFNFYAR